MGELGSSAIKVIVRIKPQNGELKHTDKTVEIVNSKEQSVKYTFDRVFGPEALTRDIYEMLRPAIKGRGAAGETSGQGSVACAADSSDAFDADRNMPNTDRNKQAKIIEEKETDRRASTVTILAYGQTGSGKTHTMSGNESAPGLVPLVFKELLLVSSLSVSFMEIYNERIIDLLDGKEKALREAQGTVVVQGLVSRRVAALAEFESLARVVALNRKTGETRLNKTSSRSHLITRIETPGRSISLVDLAGSENNRRTGNAGLRMEESSSINRSLFAFNKVVNAIVDGEKWIPYRDSKLTRLMQDSIGGAGECYLIATLVDSLEEDGEAVNTLNFASRSRQIVKQRRVKAEMSTAGDLYERLHSGKAVKKAGCREAAKEEPVSEIKRYKKESGSMVDGNMLDRSANAIDKDTADGSIVNAIEKDAVDGCMDKASTDPVKKAKQNSSSLLLNRSAVEMTPITKQKSTECFMAKARDYEENGDHRAALEIYKTIKKFADTELVDERIKHLQSLLKRQITKFSALRVLEILNSGIFIDIKQLHGIGDRRAQAIVDFIAGGHFFESLSDLKMLFSEKVVKCIMECIK